MTNLEYLREKLDLIAKYNDAIKNILKDINDEGSYSDATPYQNYQGFDPTL